MPYIYILEDARGKRYIGSCVDLESRLSGHLRGNTKSTKGFKSIRVLWSKKLETLALARKAENKIKAWKSKKMIELLISGKIGL